MSRSHLEEQEAEPLLASALQLGPRDGSHKATLIFLHGLGDSADPFQDLVEELGGLDGVRVVLPNAPVRPITINGGMQMRGWYDIYHLDRRGPHAEGGGGEDDGGINSSRRRLQELLEVEAASVGSRRVVIGGFSQGAAMSVNAGLSFSQPLGGIMAYSGYVVQRTRDDLVSASNRDTPVLAYHGGVDGMVPVAFAAHGYGTLQRRGVKVQFVEEPDLDHSISQSGLLHMRSFLDEHLLSKLRK